MKSCLRQPTDTGMKQMSGGKYAVIDGRQVALPVDARFYFQDKRGCWYWSSRKPRVKGDDWTPNKAPVQIQSEKGYHRCLITPARVAADAWRDTVMRVVCRDNMPLVLSR